MSKTDGLKIGSVVVAAGAILFFSLWQRSPNVAEIGGYSPDFTLPVFDAGSRTLLPVHLREHRGHVVLVNFWASWCPPCVEEAPSLEGFSTKMRQRGVEVIGISVDQDSEALRKFLSEHRLTFPILRDPDQIVASKFGSKMWPETYILDRDGRVAEKIIGATNWEDPQMISFVENLAGLPPHSN